MTKVTQGHWKWRDSYSIDHISLPKFLQVLCIVTMLLSCTIFKILPLTLYVTACEAVTSRSHSVLIQQLKSQVVYTFWFACKHIIANVLYFQGIRFRKVSSSWNHHQGHSRSLVMVPFDKPHMISH